MRPETQWIRASTSRCLRKLPPISLALGKLDKAAIGIDVLRVSSHRLLKGVSCAAGSFFAVALAQLIPTNRKFGIERDRFLE